LSTLYPAPAPPHHKPTENGRHYQQCAGIQQQRGRQANAEGNKRDGGRDRGMPEW
jgi:hypothetical protein